MIKVLLDRSQCLQRRSANAMKADHSFPSCSGVRGLLNVCREPPRRSIAFGALMEDS